MKNLLIFLFFALGTTLFSQSDFDIRGEWKVTIGTVRIDTSYFVDSLGNQTREVSSIDYLFNSNIFDNDESTWIFLDNTMKIIKSGENDFKQISEYEYQITETSFHLNSKNEKLTFTINEMNLDNIILSFSKEDKDIQWLNLIRL